MAYRVSPITRSPPDHARRSPPNRRHDPLPRRRRLRRPRPDGRLHVFRLVSPPPLRIHIQRTPGQRDPRSSFRTLIAQLVYTFGGSGFAGANGSMMIEVVVRRPFPFLSPFPDRDGQIVHSRFSISCR